MSNKNFLFFIAALCGISCFFAYAEDDHEKELYDKVVAVEQEYTQNPSSSTFDNWLATSRNAYETYPKSERLAARYAYIATLEFSNPMTGIKVLLPFVQETGQSSEISFALWRIFNFGYINTKGNGPWYLAGYWDKILHNDMLSPEESLSILTGYWSSQINLEKLPPEYDKKRNSILESRKLLSVSQESQAKYIWRTAIENIGTYDMKQQAIAAAMLLEQEERERYLQEDAERKEKRRAAFEQALPGFDLLLTQPNDYMKILEVFSKFINFGKELREYPDIPNYQKLKAEFVDSEEAEVLNIAYKVYLRREFREALAAIGQLETADSDTRLLWYRIYCLSELKEQPAAILPYLEKLLQLTPGDLHAQAMKQHLEKELEAESAPANEP